MKRVDEQFFDCPYCGSDNLNFAETFHNDHITTEIIECIDCRQTWDEIYEFQYSNLEEDA